jgi:hypothetical protein
LKKKRGRFWHSIIYIMPSWSAALRNEVDGSTDRACMAQSAATAAVDLAIAGLELAFSTNGTGAT